MALGDASQLQSAILNLGLNARDAIRDTGRIVFSTSHRMIDGDEPGGEGPDVKPGLYAQITVTDNGEGMGEETLGHIFEPFFTTKEVGKGTGLGLAVVYGCVTAHHGGVQVQSEPGGGTTVRLLIPAAEDRQEQEPEPPEEPREGAGRVLVIDDEPGVCRFAERVLRSAGYEVRGFTDPAEAREHLAADPDGADLVLLDMVMPEIPGPDLYADLRAIRPGLVVVFTSGYSRAETPPGLLADPNVTFLRKPFDVVQLTQAVGRALAPKETDEHPGR
jgi:CheY-like chemotaxis protein